MHPNPAFRGAETADNIAYARERGFGVLAVNGNALPLMSHVPFLLSEDGATADLHLVRSNPISRTIDGLTPARIAVTGPDSYISPDWYGVEDQVPTWNYVAVHLTGHLEPRPESELPSLLEKLSLHFEERLLPKPIWTQAKMHPDALTKMLRMIRPFRLTVEDIQGTWKLNQNKPDEVRLSAADHVAAYGIGSDPQLLAALMKSPEGKTNT
ncbi:FMN-binding negative transcriptional regulator [uncultured Shimia sp.]|uniref:FMN-binding negative transcriptional regulator n=1 Tax=uncultured Shimia sp. TaxID=573152 RepID=UPI002603DEB8|nr:FMN-binding negative transcriptional regulator [uncultured Shimia sp.]